MARPAVFLDRDGTLIHDAGYLGRLEDLRWYPWGVEAVRVLNRAGFLVFVVTNQGGIGLGLFDGAFVDVVHREMTAVLEAGGARVDGWLYCPHHPASEDPALRIDCDCRKPRPGLVLRAAEAFDIELVRSFTIGDKLSDVELAGRVGARGVLVRTGYGEEIVRTHRGVIASAAYIAADLMDATSWVLLASGHPHATQTDRQVR